MAFRRGATFRDMNRYACALLLVALPAFAQPMTFDGTICRMNRAADRMIIGADAGPRLRIVADHPKVTYEGIKYDLLDLRPGDHVRIGGNRNGSMIRATAIDTKVHVPAEITADALVPSRTIVGRFADGGDIFTLALPGQHRLRVDGSRVRVGALHNGDLLEVRGERSDDILRATSINVITDREDASCRENAMRGESPADTAAREASEIRFLQGGN